MSRFTQESQQQVLLPISTAFPFETVRLPFEKQDKDRDLEEE
jgi:hypothetical protein